MEKYGFITVRVASSRLKRKCLLPFGKGNVLEHVIRRAKYYGFTPVVCTTDLKEDDVIEDIAKKEGVLCFRGSSQDKLKRWLDACETFGIEAFHTIDADDPFFDGDSDLKSYEMLVDSGYDVIYPPKHTYVGSIGFSIRTDLIREACAIKQSNDTEMMWYYLEKVPGINKTEFPVDDVRAENIRLTLDYEEDYWMLRTVLQILGPNADRFQIEDLFLRNPDLYKMNWFRNEQWAQGQLAKKV